MDITKQCLPYQVALTFFKGRFVFIFGLGGIQKAARVKHQCAEEQSFFFE